jgi:poly(hydroxyalkanoate) depolymerase family esterase
MKWSADLKALQRGLRLAGKFAGAELRNWQPPLARPMPARTAKADGDMPGRLRMLTHLPPTPVLTGRPLVVVLHGCGQQARAFATATGWCDFADRAGIPLVLPEQAEENNQGRCFRWFQPAQIARDKGEAAAIAAMVRKAATTHRSDRNRIYVVGLSAGGAMAAALLAGYPDLFAAGAVVGGLPVGAASSSVQALMRMAQAGPARSPEEWAAAARALAAPGYRGPWPRLSIWAGEADTVVVPDNAALLATQWRALHGLAERPVSELRQGGARCRRWGGPPPAVELWTIPGLTHGYPVGEGVGHPAPYVPRCALAATPRIASFWGI